jgi:hypothetical protein
MKNEKNLNGDFGGFPIAKTSKFQKKEPAKIC